MKALMALAIAGGVFATSPAFASICSQDFAERYPANVLETCRRASQAETDPAKKVKLLRAFGEALDRTGDAKAAIAAYDAALALTPNDADLWMNKAWSHYALNEMDRADAATAQAAAREPRNARALAYAGTRAWAALQTSRAQQLFDESIAADPTNAFALRQRADLARAHGRLDDALRDFRAILALGPDRLQRAMLRGGTQNYTLEGSVRYEIAQLLMEMHRPKEARVEIDNLLSFGASIQALTLRLQASHALKDHAAVATDGAALLKLDPKQHWARLWIADAQTRLGRSAEALDALKGGLGEATMKSVILSAMARARGSAGDLDGAARDLLGSYMAGAPSQKKVWADYLRNYGYLRAPGEAPPDGRPVRDAFTACSIDRECLTGELL